MPNLEIASLTALTGGLAAGAVGTAAMDLVWFVRYKRGGGQSSLAAWEFSAGLNSWDSVPAPALVGKRLVETLTRREFSERYARSTNNVVHWVYGMTWGALYGVLAHTVLGGNVVWGFPFGFAVWASSYITLPLMGLYKPMWRYDLSTLGKDLSAHLVYGLGTALTFFAIAR